ncbi:DUF3102 domain-containing protein [Staphylococcus aureus]|nr:DUF3102 domain-containing protein [Staphylococcus aureus]
MSLVFPFLTCGPWPTPCFVSLYKQPNTLNWCVRPTFPNQVRRLKHVKENDLAHGEFGEWLKSVNLSHSTANKMMKVSSELNSYTYTNLGLNALDMIATLPEPERTKEHVTSKGGK